MYTSKFITLGLSTLLECAGGASYAFSLYSPALKQSLGYTQFQINNIANPAGIAIIVNLLPGIVYDKLQRHNRLGPRVTLLIGGAVHLIGYGGLWLAGTHRISHPPYWIVVLLGVLAMNGAYWTDVSCVASNIRSFPYDRGSVIGIMKSTMGLSASVLAVLYSVTMEPDALDFILVIGLSLPILVLLSVPFFNAVPFRQVGEVSEPGQTWSNGFRFSIVYCTLGLLSAFMLVASYTDVNKSNLSRSLVLTGMAVVFLPFFFLWPGSSGLWARPAPHAAPAAWQQDEESSTAALEESLLLPAFSEQNESESKADETSDGQTWPLEMTTRQSLLSLDFWLLFFNFGAGSACGLLFLQNCGQLVQSLDGPKDGQDPLLSLFSILNCIGRLLFGYLPEVALHKWGTPRSAFLVGVSVCMAGVTFCTGLASEGLLWVTAPICGLFYGAHWSLMPALASEFFGLSHFGNNYCILSASVGIGSYVIANVLGSYIYQSRAEEHGDKGNICIGPDCFRATFLITALLEAAAVVAAVLLYRRTAYMYALEHRDIKQEEEEVRRCPDTGHRLVRRRNAALHDSEQRSLAQSHADQ